MYDLIEKRADGAPSFTSRFGAILLLGCWSLVRLGARNSNS
jgi:hypothetical protein